MIAGSPQLGNVGYLHSSVNKFPSNCVPWSVTIFSGNPWSQAAWAVANAVWFGVLIAWANLRVVICDKDVHILIGLSMLNCEIVYVVNKLHWWISMIGLEGDKLLFAFGHLTSLAGSYIFHGLVQRNLSLGRSIHSKVSNIVLASLQSFLSVSLW